MKRELAYYDIYPKIVRAGEISGITVRGLGAHADFDDDAKYYVHIMPVGEMTIDRERRDYPVIEVTAQEKKLKFEYGFGCEQRYILWIARRNLWTIPDREWKNEWRVELRMYALDEDLFALRPAVGNMHVHTCRSDGVESPAVTAACYRSAGHDFIAITDHRQYEPSLEAIEAYDTLDLDFKLFAGEEIHPVDNRYHIVNFAGNFSINSWMREHPGDYAARVAEIEAALDMPACLSKREYASSLCVFEKIREAEGLSILCHPAWITGGVYNIPTEMYRYFLTHPEYDALELINGGDTPPENLEQVQMWYNTSGPGKAPSVVGNDDSHGAVNGEWFNIGKTYLLTESLKKEDIIESIRKGLSCAVEQYHGQHARIYGRERLVRFFSFLHEEYWPLYNTLCAAEGHMMLAWLNGDEAAGKCLEIMKGRTRKFYEHMYGIG